MRISDHEASFADTNELGQETERDLEYEVIKRSMKLRKTNAKPNNMKQIGVYVLIGILLVMIFIACSLRSSRDVSKIDKNSLNLEKGESSADSDEYPMHENAIDGTLSEDMEDAPVE